MENRNEIARQLAINDGHDPDKMDDVLRRAYLHAADCDIKTRNEPEPEINEKPKWDCYYCHDAGYHDGKKCPECNPVGLPAEAFKKPEFLIIPEALPDKTIEETAEVAREIIDSQVPEGEEAEVLPPEPSKEILPPPAPEIPTRPPIRKAKPGKKK